MIKNEFVERLKMVEQELTDLKTATSYTSIRSSVESSWTGATTGVYKITYNTQGESVMSMFFSEVDGIHYPNIMPQTINGDSQIVQINTTYYESSSSGYIPITDRANITVVSNVPIRSIAKIG